MRAWAILLAAGTGSRMGEATNGVAKQFIMWKNAPLYWHSALTYSRAARIAGLVFVFAPENLEAETARLRTLYAAHDLGLPWKVVAGGALRQDSVRNGLAALAPHTADAAYVLIHDTARPFATPTLVNRVLDGLGAGACGVIPGIAVTDTIKVVHEGRVAATPERAGLRAVQTPQGFHAPTLAAAHERAVAEGWVVTDDAALLERCGEPVLVVEGEPGNHKMTNPEDMDMLHPHTPEPCVPRVGFGYDVHRFAGKDAASPRPMRLGGVSLPHGPMVLAHSDGDVLLHALADALLGCCAGGDIGRIFPDTDPACEGMHSAVIVEEALSRLHAQNMRLVHTDLTVITQTPKIAPHAEEIRRNVARLLRLPLPSVNLKATTEEGLGFTGAKEGIKAVAVTTAIHCNNTKAMAD